MSLKSSWNCYRGFELVKYLLPYLKFKFFWPSSIAWFRCQSIVLNCCNLESNCIISKSAYRCSLNIFSKKCKRMARNCKWMARNVWKQEDFPCFNVAMSFLNIDGLNLDLMTCLNEIAKEKNFASWRHLSSAAWTIFLMLSKNKFIVAFSTWLCCVTMLKIAFALSSYRVLYCFR